MLFQGERVWQKKCREKHGMINTDRTGNTDMFIQRKKEHALKKRERNYFHSCHGALRSPLCRPGMLLPGKVSFRTSWKKMKKASLTLETAMVMPLFMLGLISMISFMDVYKLQTEHLVRLCEKAKLAGMCAYAFSGQGTEEITLPDFYTYRPPGGIVPLPSLWLHTSVKVRAWTGKEWEVFQDSGRQEEEMVYVTEKGRVYHRNPGCSYLNPSVNQVGSAYMASMTNQYGQHYSACEICCAGQAPGGSVYITSSGNRYHNLESCSGLKRTVRMVKHAQVKGMPACSRCG